MIDPDRLLAYACGHDDDEVDAHVLSCGACASMLEHLVAIGEAVRALVTDGRMRFAMGPELAADLARIGLLAKEYTMEPDASVACSVGRTDVYQSMKLRADLSGVERVDVVIHYPGAPKRIVDVPFAAARGFVWLVERGDVLRTLPTHSGPVELFEVKGDGERLVARYRMDHTAAP